MGSSLQKLGFVPEAQNDMIFSIICEETGLAGSWFLIFLFALLIWRLMVIATHARDLCGELLAVGIMGHIAMQVILTLPCCDKYHTKYRNYPAVCKLRRYFGTVLLGEMGLALAVSRDSLGG